MSSTNNDNLEDDFMMFTMDPLNTFDEEDESHSNSKSDLSTSDYHSFVATTDTSLPIESSPIKLPNNNKSKMFDITELLGSSSFDDKKEICHWFEKLQPISTSSPSLNVVDYLRAQTFKHDQDIYENYQWQMEQNHLKYDSKQLSPSDYLTRKSLYNRPVAFEKDSRSWARSLLDNFKKTTNDGQMQSIINYSFIENSPSFDHHMQYIEHLNECNDYPAYLEYLNENRSQLFYTLTDSLDIIDGLLGTVVSSF